MNSARHNMGYLNKPRAAHLTLNVENETPTYISYEQLIINLNTIQMPFGFRQKIKHEVDCLRPSTATA